MAEPLNGTTLCGNMLTAMLHREEGLLPTALEQAKAWASEKRDKLEAAVIACLAAVAEGDVEAASLQLDLAAKAFSGQSMPRIDSNFSGNILPVYGLYFAAKAFWPEEMFARLKRPSKRPGWWDEYVEVCLADPPPEVVLPFPEDLDFLNEALLWIERA